MTDLFVLLQLPNAGDELQAIKKGVLELADLVVVNKADLDPAAAARAVGQIESALQLVGHRPSSAWSPRAMASSALDPAAGGGRVGRRRDLPRRPGGERAGGGAAPLAGPGLAVGAHRCRPAPGLPLASAGAFGPCRNARRGRRRPAAGVGGGAPAAAAFAGEGAPVGRPARRRAHGRRRHRARAGRICPSRFRIKVLETSVGRVVAKRQRPDRSAWRARAVNVLARGIGIPLLQAVPAHGGARAQSIEVARLRALRAAGLRVPASCMSMRSSSSSATFPGAASSSSIEAGGAAGWDAWRDGLDAIAEGARPRRVPEPCLRPQLHRRARPAAGDDRLRGRPAGSPLAASGAGPRLARLPAFDALAAAVADDAAPVVASRLARAEPAVRALVEGAGRRLALLRHLPRSRRIGGREVAGVRALAAFLPLLASSSTSA